MEPVAEHRVGDMSKSEILRGIITEKLSTAAREILAAVERTVSGYEEEAAGFRLEVERQRRQLEALLQVSDIKLEETDDQQLFPISEPSPEEPSGSGEPVKDELSVEADGGMSLLCFTRDYTEEEEKKSSERASPTPTKDQETITELDFDTLSGLVPPSVQSDRPSAGRRRRVTEAQNHVDLRVRILGDSGINILSSEVFQKYPLQELQCPRGLQETDFLQLLRSTFPLLVADFEFFKTNRSRKLHPLEVQTLTPEEIQRSIRSYGNSALYIRLKAPDEAQSSKERICLLQGRVDAADETRLSKDDVQPSSSTSPGQEDDINTKESNHDSLGLWPPLVSDIEREEEETLKTENDWKPDRRKKNLRNKKFQKTGSGAKTKRRRIRLSPSASPPWALTSNGEALPSCKVCGAVRGSVSLVIKHAWSHVDDPARLCGVCGKGSKSAEKLRQHLQSHKKTHGCRICGKFFLSTNGLKGHIARHNGEKSYECKICHKSFTKYWVLSTHMMIHAVKTLHTCDVCQKSFPSKMNLKVHLVTHSGKKPFSCNICTKSYCSLKTLSQHMLTHSSSSAARARSHVCEICSKKFHTSWKLQAHMRSHSDGGGGERSGKFSSKSKLIHTL